MPSIAVSASSSAERERTARLVARVRWIRAGFRLDAELDAPVRGVTAVFGPSGAGKSTLLRCIAGLERAPDATIALGGEVWQDEERRRFVPAHRRAIGVVFQEPALFPHLAVRENLLYGWTRTPHAERRFGLERIATLLGVFGLLDRRPAQLSGGERQRVAIGRALLASPRLLLLDEPLASVDVRRKREILPFLRRIHDEIDVPTLYVSHSLAEILDLADSVALMREGRIVAAGPIEEVFARLELRKELGEDAAGAVIDALVEGHDAEFGLTRVVFEGRALEVPHRALPLGGRVRIHVRPRDVGISIVRPAEGASALNVLEARIVEVASADDFSVDLKLDAGRPLIARITRKSYAHLGLALGRTVWAQLKTVSLSDELAE